MKKILEGLLFFVGWMLSPFTWWNDTFINIPLSYLVASVIFYIVPIQFKYLLIGTYWFTNIVGIWLVYSKARSLILSSKNRLNAIGGLVLVILVYTFIMLYLDSKGKLIPFFDLFKHNVAH